MYKNIILASKSPRRQEILQKCNIPFICIPSNIEEVMDMSLPLEERIKDLAFQKANAILQEHPDCVVIGSDTIVTYDGTILGKPKSRNHAFEMIKMIQGKTHQVYTGLAILSGNKKFLTCTISNVTFTAMSDDEINAYLDTGESFDKAGAYGIQGYGGRYITNIDGDYYSIMGLPLSIVYQELQHLEQY